MNPSVDDLAEMQRKFRLTVERWSAYRSDHWCHLHLPHIACFLHAVGYKLTRLDYVKPEHVPVFSGDKKGTSVVITCGHSGMRCFFELPEKLEKCNCLSRMKEGKDPRSAEQKKMIVEFGHEVIPPMSQDLKKFIRNVLSFVCCYLNGEKDMSTSTVEVDTSTKVKTHKLFIDLQPKDGGPPTATLTPPTPDASLKSPSASTSKMPAAEKKSPGAKTPQKKSPAARDPLSNQLLNQTLPLMCQSSPNLKLSTSPRYGESSSYVKEDFDKERVILLLENALSIVRNYKQDVSPERATFEAQSSKFGSTPDVSPKSEDKSPSSVVSLPAMPAYPPALIPSFPPKKGVVGKKIELKRPTRFPSGKFIPKPTVVVRKPDE